MKPRTLGGIAIVITFGLGYLAGSHPRAFFIALAVTFAGFVALALYDDWRERTGRNTTAPRYRQRGPTEDAWERLHGGGRPH